MIDHFAILFLSLLTFICLFNPTLSADKCAKCKKSFNQIGGSNPAIELKNCNHSMHKKCLIKQLEEGNKDRCSFCQSIISGPDAIQKLHNLHPQMDENDGTFINFVKKNLPKVESQKEFNEKEKEEIRKSILYENEYFYETHLGVMFLMRENWNCAKFEKEFEKEKKILKDQFEQQKEINQGGCERYQNYVNILYEYLFEVFLEGANPKLTQQIPTVKPKISKGMYNEVNEPGTLIDAVNSLSKISDFLFDPITRSYYNRALKNLFVVWPEPILENDEKLVEKGQKETEKGTKENFMKKINNFLNKEKQNETQKEAAREKFDKIMEKMSEIAKTLTKEDRKEMPDKIGVWWSPFLPK